MIKVTVYQNSQGRYTGFSCIGHAEYARPGEDIVCAGVSALVINTVNAIGAFTDEPFDAKADQKSGFIDIQFHDPAGAGHDAQLLLKAMAMGLSDIQQKYGTKYSILTVKEV